MAKLKKLLRGDRVAWVEPESQGERDLLALGFAPPPAREDAASGPGPAEKAKPAAKVADEKKPVAKKTAAKKKARK